MKNILKRGTFFDNLEDLSHLLKQIKNSIVELESDTCNLADCYFNLVKLAVAINLIPKEYNKSFRNYCIYKYNKRWQDFEYDEFLLCFFLHPAYKGINEWQINIINYKK